MFNDQWQAADQLKQVVRTIMLSSEFKDVGTWSDKTKRPFELIAGTLAVVAVSISTWCGQRLLVTGQQICSTGGISSSASTLYRMMSETGQLPFSWVTPDGFPDTQAGLARKHTVDDVLACTEYLFLDWVPKTRPTRAELV